MYVVATPHILHAFHSSLIRKCFSSKGWVEQLPFSSRPTRVRPATKPCSRSAADSLRTPLLTHRKGVSGWRCSTYAVIGPAPFCLTERASMRVWVQRKVETLHGTFPVRASEG